MSLKKDIKAARDAMDKLHRYSTGVHAAGGRDATKKYLELNSKADKAIKKLPFEYRSIFALELSRLIIK